MIQEELLSNPGCIWRKLYDGLHSHVKKLLKTIEKENRMDLNLKLKKDNTHSVSLCSNSWNSNSWKFAPETGLGIHFFPYFDVNTYVLKSFQFELFLIEPRWKIFKQ